MFKIVKTELTWELFIFGKSLLYLEFYEKK